MHAARLHLLQVVQPHRAEGSVQADGHITFGSWDVISRCVDPQSISGRRSGRVGGAGRAAVVRGWHSFSLRAWPLCGCTCSAEMCVTALREITFPSSLQNEPSGYRSKLNDHFDVRTCTVYADSQTCAQRQRASAPHSLPQLYVAGGGTSTPGYVCKRTIGRKDTERRGGLRSRRRPFYFSRASRAQTRGRSP